MMLIYSNFFLLFYTCTGQNLCVLHPQLFLPSVQDSAEGSML